jgi:hypothetical protein
MRGGRKGRWRTQVADAPNDRRPVAASGPMAAYGIGPVGGAPVGH